MRLVDIDQSAEDSFLCCLRDEKPQNAEVTQLRRRWYDDRRRKGLRAKVLLREDSARLGMCQYIPIEHSHFIGRDLMAILCIWVHGYEHLAGNQQHQGYGRFILESIENDARASGVKGMAAWGMSWPTWNPVSFYERMGYTRVETAGPVVLVWKPFATDAEPPSLLRQNRAPQKLADKVRVSMFVSGWCGVSCHWAVDYRAAIAGLGDRIVYEEIDTSDRETMLSWGIDDGLYIDGECRTGCSASDMRAEVLRILKQREL